jgi:V8-like Glu-specific endopeptidase
VSPTLESPFLDDELFKKERAPDREPRVLALVAESPFLDALAPTGDAINSQGNDAESHARDALDDGPYEYREEIEQEEGDDGYGIHDELDEQGVDDEQEDIINDAEAESGVGLLEGFAPRMSRDDLRKHIDEYFDLANTEYTLADGTKVKARSQFRYAKSGGIDEAKARLARTLGSSFEKKHPRAVHYAVYGRAKPAQIAAITQALIDAGELDALRRRRPSLTHRQLIRRMQREFGIGIDCAGYVQLAFIYAFMRSDNDSKQTRQNLGLQERRGNERLSSLPSSHFKKLTSVTDAETGDLLVLKPRDGDADRAWHTVIIVERSSSGTEHTFLGDASWGTDLYGEDAGGIARRQLVHDTATGEWWDIHPITGDEAHRNRVGPYNKHKLYGVFRAKQSTKKVKPAPELEAWLEEAETNTDCTESGFGIIGKDDRRRVGNSLEIPCRWICQLWVRRRDSDGKTTVTGSTGVLISPRHVLTTAHLVCEARKNDRGQWITYDASDIRVVPARDGDDRPVGTYDVKMPAAVAPLWNPKGKPAGFDYALLTLEKPIGEETFKRLGGNKLCYWGSRACGRGTTLRPVSPSRLEGRTVITAGYPKDKGGKTPYITTGQLSNVSASRRTMDISADACQGQSGSPVWMNVGGEHCMVGMLLSVKETTNVALRFTDEICAQLRSWLKGASDVCAPSPGARRELEFEDADLESDEFGMLEAVSEDADELETETDEGAAGELIAASEDVGDAGDELEYEWVGEVEPTSVVEEATDIATRELDPALADIAERIARGRPLLEHQAARSARRWTKCFSAADIERVRKVYADNASAAAANSGDRCSCIVMLNVALGQLLQLTLKDAPARSSSTRRVQMAALTTESIDKAMQQLKRKGFAAEPIVINFYDRRNRTAGTLKPEKLKTGAQTTVLDKAAKEGCWYAYGMSIMDGYHSVLLLVDHTTSDKKIYWLDQFSSGIDDDVTLDLDQRLTNKTQAWWQAVMDRKGKGYNTMIRLSPLSKRT